MNRQIIDPNPNEETANHSNHKATNNRTNNVATSNDNERTSQTSKKSKATQIDGSRPQALVQEFHTTYDMPDRLRDKQSTTLNYERLGMRLSLIAEEVAELFQAVYGGVAEQSIREFLSQLPDHQERNLVETADALGDLVYVIYGMALESGIDLDAVLAEIHHSNLSKLMPDGSVKRREDGKILKGPNFSPPNIAAVLEQRQHDELESDRQ